ncbi:hypothetical protein Psuf_069420 [Phytohabitans suffuscus]|uniref:Uncharacterized protein n=1 Tax=Phytohabitans suffuscus TaxID=624315 RepID=A0A6F8YU77_9ACTN|nr:hypothetical protein Psuf_069420 [Phytohabitans suffuscus]
MSRRRLGPTTARRRALSGVRVADELFDDVAAGDLAEGQERLDALDALDRPEGVEEQLLEVGVVAQAEAGHEVVGAGDDDQLVELGISRSWVRIVPRSAPGAMMMGM